MINWQCKTFEQLTTIELYNILKLRSQIFVVEQNCVFLDVDDIDQLSYHYFATDNQNNVVAYTRLIPKNVVYDYCSIGRVVVVENHRKNGFGKQLMQQSISKCFELFGKETIKIGAQFYLKQFYESLGFYQSSEIYLEDGINHIHMLLKP